MFEIEFTAIMVVSSIQFSLLSRTSPDTVILIVSKRSDRTDRSVVFPDPEAPIIPHRPPEIEPSIPLIIAFGGIFLRALVVTDRFCQVKMAGALHSKCNNQNIYI